MSGWVVITDAPVYMRERGGGDGENVDSEELSLLSYTLKYINLTDATQPVILMSGLGNLSIYY